MLVSAIVFVVICLGNCGDHLFPRRSALRVLVVIEVAINSTFHILLFDLP